MSVITTLIATIVASPIFASAPVQAVIAALGLGGATVAGQVLALGLIGALGIFALALGSYMLVNNKGMGLWNSPSEKDGGSVSESPPESEPESEKEENDENDENDENVDNRGDTLPRARARGCSKSDTDEDSLSSSYEDVSRRLLFWSSRSLRTEHWWELVPFNKMPVEGQDRDNSSNYDYLVARRKKLN